MTDEIIKESEGKETFIVEKDKLVRLNIPVIELEIEGDYEVTWKITLKRKERT